WNTGLASTYRSGPNVQFRFAWTIAEYTRLNGATKRSTVGGKPINSTTTSARANSRSWLTGWNRARAVQSSTCGEWCTAWKGQAARVWNARCSQYRSTSWMSRTATTCNQNGQAVTTVTGCEPPPRIAQATATRSMARNTSMTSGTTNQ